MPCSSFSSMSARLAIVANLRLFLVYCSPAIVPNYSTNFASDCPPDSMIILNVLLVYSTS